MKTTFHEFKLSSTYKGDKYWDSSDTRYQNRNNHIITVRNTLTNKKTTFEFWESIMEREIKTERQLIWAFECFLTDALATIQARDVWDFFSEFGYEPSRKSFDTYNACKRSERKALRVVGDESRLCDLVNEINEMEY